MSGQASDWLSVERLARELRLADADGNPPADIASLLADHILAAVDWVSHESGLPLVDRPVVLPRADRLGSPGVFFPSTNAPIILGRLLNVTSVDRVDYWTDDVRSGAPQALVRMRGDDPIPDVGRLDEVPSGTSRLSFWRLYPRASGWPEAPGGFRVMVSQGLNPALYPALSQACVLMARQFFEGAVVEEKVTAARRLYERYTVEADES